MKMTRIRIDVKTGRIGNYYLLKNSSMHVCRDHELPSSSCLMSIRVGDLHYISFPVSAHPSHKPNALETQNLTVRLEISSTTQPEQL